MAIVAQALRGSLASLIVLVGAGRMSAAADDTGDRHAKMTAAYVFNFIKFVEWPLATATDAVDVCFGGADSVREALADAIDSKRAGGRRLTMRAVDKAESVLGCEVLYIDARSTLPLALDTGAVLTIGDAPDFTQRGGIIGLYVEDNRLRFTINIKNASRARLQVSSNLLQLATHIEPQERRD